MTVGVVGIEVELVDVEHDEVWCVWCNRVITPERHAHGDGEVALVYVHDDCWHPEDITEVRS